MNGLRWLGVAIIVAACTYIGLDLRSCHEASVVKANVAVAEAQHQAATASAAQGVSDVQNAQAQASVVAVDDAKVAADMARRAHRPGPVPVPPAPGSPDPQPAAEPVAQDDGTAQMIADQAKEIDDLKAQVVTLNLAVTHYRIAYEDAEKESTARQLALEGQIAACKAERWKGRSEGLAVGLAVGYAGGRL